MAVAMDPNAAQRPHRVEAGFHQRQQLVTHLLVAVRDVLRHTVLREQVVDRVRPELVEKEEGELAVLRAYLPAEASDADIEKAVEQAMQETGAASAKDIGKAMKAALAALAAMGKPADGKRVNDAVRKRLSA